MKQLILMRHAKTEPWHEGIDDAGRALLERGKLDAREVGEALLAAGVSPDHVLVSSARRTRETWAEIRGCFPSAHVRVLDELYLAEADEIMETALAADGDVTVLVIGHNPGMHDASADLVRMGGSDDPAAGQFVLGRFPTGSAAVFSRVEDRDLAEGGFRLQSVVWGREIRERKGAVID